MQCMQLIFKNTKILIYNILVDLGQYTQLAAPLCAPTRLRWLLPLAGPSAPDLSGLQHGSSAVGSGGDKLSVTALLLATECEPSGSLARELGLMAKAAAAAAVATAAAAAPRDRLIGLAARAEVLQPTALPGALSNSLPAAAASRRQPS